MTGKGGDVLVKLSARMKTGGLLRDTTHLSIGQGFRLVIQAAYFVLIARSLGPDAYGAFVTVVAMAALLGPFSGIGTQNLFVKNVRSGKREAAICWGNGILLTVLSGSLFSAIAVGLSFLLGLKTAALVVIIVCLSDLVFLKVTELAAFGFAASDQMKQTSIQNVVVSLLRLAGIAALIVLVHQVTLERWVFVYLLTSLLGTGYAVWKGSLLWGRPSTDLAALREDVAEGVYFSIANSASTVYNDIDKIMLSRLADLSATGVYGAAYRVIDVSMTPVRSLATAAYPLFFRKGLGGIRATYPYARSLMAKAVLYGSIASVALWLLAPVLPYILGPRYAVVVVAVRWLAPIPLLRCFHSFLADALSGAGLQRARTAIQVFVALINIGANLVILPRYSWRGAAWTSLACDGLLVVVFWSAALYYCRSAQAAANPLHTKT
jgi:O-antigen/teichoic acid export membrane protein